MSLADSEAKIQKHVAAIVKLGKAETSDKTKAGFLKDVVDLLKQAKTFEKTQTDLNKRIKEAKALSDDIAKYQKEFGAFIKDAVKLSQTKINPDTKDRDYFMIENFLSTIGSSSQLDDYP